MILFYHIHSLFVSAFNFSCSIENEKPEKAKKISIHSNCKFIKHITSFAHYSPFCEERTEIPDINGVFLYNSNIPIQFTFHGPGEPIEKDNEDQLDRNIFNSHNRDVFDGLGLAFIRSKDKQAGKIYAAARTEGMEMVSI